MITSAGWVVVVLWAWPGDTTEAPEVILTDHVYTDQQECRSALRRDLAQLVVELQQDAGYPGTGRGICQPVYTFNRVEVTL